MCVHVHDGILMRTTIDLPDDLHMQLLQAAARDRRKGFSHIVQVALQRYFAAPGDDGDRARTVQGLKGSLSADEADTLRERIADMRRKWR